ncbi:MAG: STAS domain-containing protein [Acidobacteriota bacterium]
MRIKTRTEEDVILLDLEGRLNIGEGDVMLREEVNDALAAGHKKLLLNLQGVRAMDSSGLGELIRAKTSAEAAGATIKLLHVEDKVQEVLDMTRLIGVFDTYNDEIDAFASFRD